MKLLKNKKHFRKYIFFIWLSFVIFIFLGFIYNNNLSDVILSNILVTENQLLLSFLFLILVTITSIFLVPSTPFIVGGLFFLSPFIVFFVGLFGIFVSVTVVYYFARHIGLDIYLEKKYPKKLNLLKNKLKNKELFIITIWSITPFVATDLIVYAASTLKISFRKCVVGTLVGEGLLNLIYILTFVVIL